MSDTDTDDTDLLLLIPPTYYTDSVEILLRKDKMSGSTTAAAVVDALAMPPPPVPASTTAVYQFLPASKKSELNHINARLQNIELENDRFDMPSDISTISVNTVRTVLGSKKVRDLHGLVHSTPKSGSELNEQRRNDVAAGSLEDNILLEIDTYLDEHNQCNRHGWQQHHSDDYLRERERTAFGDIAVQESQASSLPSALIGQQGMASSHLMDSKLNKISLRDLWGKSELNCSPLSQGLKEEQLRRQHLEKTVRVLQSQLLEYQQRISVAIEIDTAKDAALANAEQTSKTLNFEIQQLRDMLHRLEAERSENGGKLDSLQHELAQAVGLATKFQEKNEKLEKELEVHRRQLRESNEGFEQLELQLQGSKRAEELTHAELSKLRDKYTKVDYQQEKLKLRIEELEKEKNTLTQQKEMLQEYHQKQKSRADSLETQRKSLQETLANLTEVETSLKKKLETQQKILKLHYQQQLENVVAQKLKEFQEQLDKSEQQLKTEARERECLIAERAVKQLEMINEKNNQELSLVQEKHSNEVELYRLQLANACKKIDELELKLSSYKTRRADMAEKLHSVMETQWQQALAILTSPNQTGMLHASDTDSESVQHNNIHNYADTPKTSKSQRSNSTEKNNLDVVAKYDPSSTMDQLQAYIELLLSKSPSDFDKLEEILAMSSKQNNKADKSNGKRGVNGKPPWKS